MLRPFAQLLRKFEAGQTFSYVQTDAATPNIVGQQCCVRLHQALAVVK